MRLFIDKNKDLVIKFGDYTSAEYIHSKRGLIPVTRAQENEFIEVKAQTFDLIVLTQIETKVMAVLQEKQEIFENEKIEELIAEKQRQVKEEAKQRRQSYDVEEKLYDIMLERSVK